MIDKMGETGEPWGVPISRLMSSDVKPLKRRRTDLSFKKDVVHLHISGAKPSDLISTASLL
jgi:hypothetical protein